MLEIEAGQDAPAVDSEAQTPAAATVKTADSPAPDTQAGASDEPTAEAKTFTQVELDAIVQKEKAKTEAKTERRVIRALERFAPQQAPQQQVQTYADNKPQRSQFANDEDFIDTLTDWKIDQRTSAGRQQTAQQEQAKRIEKTEGMYAQAALIPGFDREDFNELPLTPAIVETIVGSDVAPKLMAFMASNPDEVARISTLSPARQAAEIGKLETKVSSLPKFSNAPTPMKPIGSQATSTNNLETANFDEYKKLRIKQGAPWYKT